MDIRSGIPASPGVAFGPAFVLDAEQFRIPDRFITEGSYPDEIERLRAGLAAAAAEARDDERLLSEKVGTQHGAVFRAHALMIEDPSLTQETESLVRDKGFSAEYAVSAAFRKRRQALESVHQEYFAARVTGSMAPVDATLARDKTQR